MKKKILVLVVLFSGFQMMGQDIAKNAIGLRLGDNDGLGAEITYHRGLSDKNRLEFDLGFRNSAEISAFKIAGLYQWVWDIDSNFNWYAGVGGGIGSWSSEIANIKNSGTFMFAAGDVGIEYNFDFPLQLSLDARPEIYVFSKGYRNSNFGPDIALSVRYKF
jgi:hypothetical protein